MHIFWLLMARVEILLLLSNLAPSLPHQAQYIPAQVILDLTLVTFLLACWLEGNGAKILGEGERMACDLQGGNTYNLQIRGSRPLRGVCTISEVQRNVEIQDFSLLYFSSFLIRAKT